MRKLALFVTIAGLSATGAIFFLGKRRRVCPECKRRVQGNWKYCPHDGAKTEAKYEWD